MNNLILSNTLTMSSNEIATLVEKRHDNVKRTIESLVKADVIKLPQIEEVKNHLGQMVKEYVFSGEQGKRDSIIVVAQLSPEFTARLVDRWQELEKQLNNSTIPKTLPEALRLAADLAEKNTQLSYKVIELEPKAEALDRIAKADGSMCLTNAAKDLQVRPKDFYQFLQAKKWIYRRQGSGTFTAYQDKIQQGVLEHKVTVVTRSDGSEKTTEQVRVTPKGLARLSEMLSVDIAS